jgi:hypothetical protein
VFDLPIEVRSGGASRLVVVGVDERREVARIALDQRPEQVAVDPELSVFAATRVDKDLAWWLDELEAGSTVVARAAAAEAIGTHPEAGPSGWIRLARVAADPREPESVRRAASGAAAELLARGLAWELAPVAGGWAHEQPGGAG